MYDMVKGMKESLAHDVDPSVMIGGDFDLMLSSITEACLLLDLAHSFEKNSSFRRSRFVV